MAGWLQGFFDGEGSVSLSNRPHRPGFRHTLKATNTDYVLILRCHGFLNALGIRNKINGPYQAPERLPFWVVNVSGLAAASKYSELVGFSAPRKVSKLTEVAAWCKRPRTHGRRHIPSPSPLEDSPQLRIVE